MKRWIAVAIWLVSLMAAPARADDSSTERARVALGFRNARVPTLDLNQIVTTVPIGIRWWFGQHKLGLDLGTGYGMHKDESSGENLNAWNLDAGIPWALKSWDRVDVILRPGVNYTQQDGIEYQFVFPSASTSKVTDRIVTGTAEIEVEVFPFQNVSVSASYGIGVVNVNPGEAGVKTTTDFGTFGSNFTSLGFHVYLWK